MCNSDQQWHLYVENYMMHFSIYAIGLFLYAKLVLELFNAAEVYR